MSNDTPTQNTSPEVPAGAPVVTYRSHSKVSLDKTLASLVLFVLCGIAFVVGAETEQAPYLVFWVGFAVVLFVAGVSGLTYGLIFRTRLSIYGNGVLVESTWAKTFTRWEDIEAIFEFDPPVERNWLGVETKTFQLGFSRFDGKTFWFHINRMSGLREFAARLHQQIDERVHAWALRTLAAGEVAWFGPIGIGRDGFHSHKGLLPWAEVSFAGCVRDTDFEALKKGSNWGWFSQKIRNVENVAILNALIKSRKEWLLPS